MKYRPLVCLLAAALFLSMLPGCYETPHTTQPGTTASGDTTPPSTVGTDPTIPVTTVPETTVPVTTIPESTVPETTVPEPPETTPSTPTVPSGDKNEKIGSLYTRGELMAMENEKKAFGCGIAAGGVVSSSCKDLQNKYGKYNAYFYNPNSNSIFLTFDCGYEYSYVDGSGKTIRVTEQILDVLKEKNVKAVFFVTMHYVLSCPDLVRRMIDEGHAVGNHTANHPALPSCSVDKMVSEIRSLENYVREHFGYSMNLLRPPEGAYSTRSLALTQSLGYATLDWSFAHADWDPDKQPSKESALDAMLSRAHSGAIYLLHAVSTTNAAVLPEMIDALRSQGYTFELFEV